MAQIALMKAIGTTYADFYSGLIGQLINVGSPSTEPDEAGTNFMLSIVKGIEPRDQIEAMLAAQMAAVHMAIHDVRAPPRPCREHPATRLRRARIQQADAHLRRANVGAERISIEGRAKMTVQHVNVAGGGQAIVGNVNAPPRGEGRAKKVENNPMHLDMHRALDATRNRSGAGYRAERQPCGG